MAVQNNNKPKRRIVGDFVKAKLPTEEEKKQGKKAGAPYIKVSQDITLKKGDIISVQNKAFQIASLTAAKDKLSEDYFNERMERLEKTPDFVLGTCILVDRKSD